MSQINSQFEREIEDFQQSFGSYVVGIEENGEVELDGNFTSKELRKIADLLDKATNYYAATSDSSS